MLLSFEGVAGGELGYIFWGHLLLSGFHDIMSKTELAFTRQFTAMDLCCKISDRFLSLPKRNLWRGRSSMSVYIWKLLGNKLQSQIMLGFKPPNFSICTIAQMYKTAYQSRTQEKPCSFQNTALLLREEDAVQGDCVWARESLQGLSSRLP